MFQRVNEARGYVSRRRRLIVLAGLPFLILGSILINNLAGYSPNVSFESNTNRIQDGVPILTLDQEGFLPYDAAENIGVNLDCSDYQVKGKSIRTYQSWYDSNGVNHEGLGFCHNNELMLKECTVHVSSYGVDDYCSVG